VGEDTKQYFIKQEKESGISSGQTGKAKALCIPLEQDPITDDLKCIISGKPAKTWMLFGRSY